LVFAVYLLLTLIRASTLLRAPLIDLTLLRYISFGCELLIMPVLGLIIRCIVLCVAIVYSVTLYYALPDSSDFDVLLLTFLDYSVLQEIFPTLLQLPITCGDLRSIYYLDNTCSSVQFARYCYRIFL